MSAQQNSPQEDPIDAVVDKIPVAIPVFGAIMIFLLALIAVSMA